MARKSKKSEPQVDSAAQMFPQIGEEHVDAPADEFMPGFKTREDAVKAFDELKAARDKATNDYAAVSAAQAQMQSMIDTLMTQQGGKPGSDAPAPGKVDFSKLPDPIEDREGFTKGVMGAVEAMVSQNAAAMSQSLTKQQRTEQIWNELKARNSDLAEVPELLEAATREVLQGVRDKGIDIDKFMFGNTERMLTQISEKANARLTKLREKLGVKSEDEEGDDEGEPSRDIGLSDSSRGRPVDRSEQGGGKLGSLIGDLKNLQRTSGFF